MSTGINNNGGTVSVNDSVSIVAKVVSVSGSGSLATVTVQAPLDASTFNIVANDAAAVAHQADASHPARSINGAPFGLAGNDVTVEGVVTSISGSGQSAKLTVTLKSSGGSIVTAAGNAYSAS